MERKHHGVADEIVDTLEAKGALVLNNDQCGTLGINHDAQQRAIEIADQNEEAA